jgi:DNA repair photolyase
MSVQFVPHPLFRVEACLSPYAGCTSRCILCPYGSSARLGVKTNFLHLLEMRLKSQTGKMHIGLGTSCEPYCREEGTYHLAHNSLELLMAYEQPVQIFTKSELVLNDLASFKEYSKKGLLAVSVSLFALDPYLAEIFEPDTTKPDDRIAIIRELRRQGVFSGAVLAPIVPYISDDPVQLEELFRKVKKAGAEYLLPAVAAIETPAVRQRFITVLTEKYPRILHRIETLYERESGTNCCAK